MSNTQVLDLIRIKHATIQFIQSDNMEVKKEASRLYIAVDQKIKEVAANG